MTRNQTAFRRMKLAHRYQLVKEHGRHVASRFYLSYNVHLYALNDYYVEVWYRLSLNQIAYIEVVTDNKVLEQYLDNLDMNEEGVG